MSFKEIETEELNIPKSGISILYFSAPWCGPCRIMAPILKELAANGTNIIKIDTDKLPKIASEYQISSLPSLFFTKDGSVQAKKTGAMPKEEIITLLDGLG